MAKIRDPVVRSIKIIQLLKEGKKHRKEIIEALQLKTSTFDKLKLKLIALGEIKSLGGGYFALADWNDIDGKLTPAFEEIEKLLPPQYKRIGAVPVPYYIKICHQTRLNPDDADVRMIFQKILKKRGYYLYSKR